MVRARQTPIEPPIATATTISSHETAPDGGFSASVVRTAIAMPIMPKRLPWRDEAGEERPRNARMNRMPATR